jgi:hypothetical protein
MVPCAFVTENLLFPARMRPATLLSSAFLPAVVLLIGFFTLGTFARAGFAPFTEPGKTDFDTTMTLLNPYGTWAKVDGKWAWTPLDHAAPYTDGRWLYTEFGWYWKGNTPTSWATEHYGYWKRNADKVWAWYPGPDWLPQTVEIRASSDGIGWRSGEVDNDGSFVEPAADRLTKIDEWTFVTPTQFAGPITPAIIAQGGAAERLLEESSDSLHSYTTYRPIERPGPHPADFLTLGDGGMFAPMTDQDRQVLLHPKKPAQPLTPGPNGGPPEDPRQVKYWVTMFLPTRWTPPPVDAKRTELYIYRPDFYQDRDGIERRVALWLDPNLRSTEAIHLQGILSHRPAGAAAAPGSNVPGVAAVPAQEEKTFASPLDEPVPRSESTKSSDKSSPVNMGGAPTNAAPAPAPAGRAAQ